MRLAKIFRTARSGRLLGFTTFALIAGFWRARGAGRSCVTLIALVATPTWITTSTSTLLTGTVRREIVKLTQGAAEIFNLAFVGELLAFGHFDEFQDFLHLINRAFENFDDGHNFINRLMNGGHAMLWLDARDAFGQTLDAFDERANRDGRAARREWFGLRL